MLFIQSFVANPIRQKQRISWFWFALLLSLAPAIVCANPFNEKYISVTIIKNDNLVSICEKYLEQPKEWKKIARINGLVNPHLIFPGETLRIPSVLLKGTPIDGFVTFLKGEAMSQLPGETDWTQLHMGDPVSQGAQLKTAMESAVEITFEDGASFFLRPETTISLETARKKDPCYFMRKLFMPVGRTLLNIKKCTGTESRIEIRTPSAVSAARGTQFRVSADDAAVTRTEVLGGIVGVEAMGGDVLLDGGEGTWVKKGEAPRTPVRLLQPPLTGDLKALYQVLPSQFALTPVDNALAYRVMLSTDPDAKDVVAMAKIERFQAVPLENLEDGIYYCQTRSIDDVGLEGLPSQSKAFEIRVNPLPPFIQKPLDGQEFRQDSVTLEWLSVTDAVVYEIQVAKDPEFKDVFMDIDGIEGTREKICLDDFADYYFRVRSIARDQFKGVWSDAIGFVLLEPPKAPPVDTPKMDESKVNIRWQDLGPEISYHFQMATDSLFKEIIKDTIAKEPFISFERPEKSGVYHIRISAIDGQGYEGQFTSPQNFQIESSPYWKIGAFVSWAVIALIIAL